MLHELLLALMGHTGSIFVEEDGTVQLSPHFTFVSGSERELANRLCRLGSVYKQLFRFVEKYRGFMCVRASHDSALLGLYVRALALGVDEQLDIYRASVLQVEQEALRDASLPLLHIETAFHHHSAFLPLLLACVQRVRDQDLHGGQLLSCVHECTLTGVPYARDAFHRVLWHLLKVMYQQLISWMVHGVHEDPYAEFFIRPQSATSAIPTTAAASATSASAPSATHTGTAQTVFSSLLSAATAAPHHPNSSSSQQHSPPTSSSSSSSSVLLAPPPQPHDSTRAGPGRYATHAIHMPQLPSFMPLRVAAKVLFAGNAVLVLQHALRNGLFTDSLPESHLTSCTEELLALAEKPTFHLLTFEMVVERLREGVAKALVRLLMVDAALPARLRLLKDMFLLGNGEFYQAFLDESRGSLHQLTPRSEGDLNAMFRRAAGRVALDEDSELDGTGGDGDGGGGGGGGGTSSSSSGAGGGRSGALASFSLRVHLPPTPPASTVQQSQSQAAPLSVSRGATLSLAHSPQWPLQLLVTPSALATYNSLFQFLFTVKRVQHELHLAWQCQSRPHRPVPRGRAAHTRTASSSSSAPSWWQLRTKMSFLIDNLQYYLQVDVLETQFSILLQKLSTATDFETVSKAHDNYLAVIASQCFISVKLISSALESVFADCLKLCTMIFDGRGREPDAAELAALDKDFDRQAFFLFTILSGVRLNQSPQAPAVARLLLHIDYNHFFSLSGTSRFRPAPVPSPAPFSRGLQDPSSLPPTASSLAVAHT
eukprot:gnl/Spiro4/12596_TR6663_c0_g1_i1.p1 gnl/Spiro4/12596_TR6663_c0_g1~~gnl/Spiro4/12596_TR6663_c0_g1_i1.p1  ORF type:complete len:769 (-),score=221.58 gnl/Spiro4/12596_TR6663_c0_g1_i1:104-2410(-)